MGLAVAAKIRLTAKTFFIIKASLISMGGDPTGLLSRRRFVNSIDLYFTREWFGKLLRVVALCSGSRSVPLGTDHAHWNCRQCSQPRHQAGALSSFTRPPPAGRRQPVPFRYPLSKSTGCTKPAISGCPMAHWRDTASQKTAIIARSSPTGSAPRCKPC